MEAKRTGEIMIPLERFPHIPYWFTLRQAIAALTRSDADADGSRDPHWMLLVFSAQNELLGVLRRQEILKGLLADILSSLTGRHRDKLFDVDLDPDLYHMYFTQEKVRSSLCEQLERPVSEFMLPITTTVAPDDALIQAVCLMIDQDVGYLPVVDDGRFVGIIDAADALEAITGFVTSL
jgi:CBS domain-containing protein